MRSLKFQNLILNPEDVLSREQQKKIIGGYGDDPYTCPITTCDGYEQGPGAYYCTNTTPNECQAAADAYCSDPANDWCCDVDCAGATN